MPSHHFPNFFKRWNYPGGEVGVRLLEENKLEHPRAILHRIQCSDDLIALLMLVNASKFTDNRIREVFIPYLPYARQDRIAQWGDPQALEVLADLLQSAGILDVSTCDVHSPAAGEFFRKMSIRLKVIPQYMYCTQFLSTFETPLQKICVVVPDKGALSKSVELYSTLRLTMGAENVMLLEMNKVRDPDTGKLLKFEITNGPATIDPAFNFLIADDICDGGGTFLGVIKVVKSVYGERSSFLFTTHGIYSKGLEELHSEFDVIGCTDSFHSGVTGRNHITIPCI